MTAISSIEWTDATWNPTRGCTKVSDECLNCYAMSIAHRFSKPGLPYEGLTRVIAGKAAWNGQVRLVEEALLLPISWGRGRRIFVDSMSDLFHPGVPFEFIAKVFAVMACTSRHTYQVLTKQPARMLAFFNWLDQQQNEAGLGPCAFDGSGFPEAIKPSHVYEAWKPARNGRGGYDNCGPIWPLQNVWLGVSVGAQEFADHRREAFRQVPAAVKFVSYEPALGPVDWTGWEFVHQIISGGESGRGARASHPDWHRSTRDFCERNGIAYFFKQWGDWASAEAAGLNPDVDLKMRVLNADGTEPKEIGEDSTDWECLSRYGKRAAGRLLDGRTHDGFPAVQP